MAADVVAGVAAETGQAFTHAFVRQPAVRFS